MVNISKTLKFYFSLSTGGAEELKGDGPSECKDGILLTQKGARQQDLNCLPKLVELCFQQCVVPDTKRCGLGVVFEWGACLWGLIPQIYKEMANVVSRV